jgi:hypothetical protein
LNWFDKELQQLQDCPSVNLIIHVTRDNAASDDSSSLESTNVGDPEKRAPPVGDVEKETPVVGDIEKGKKEAIGQAVAVSGVRKVRPDIASLITDCLSQCSVDDRVGVGACGPFNMIESTREVACRSMFDNGPSITLHTEVSEIFRLSLECFGSANVISGI